MKRPPTESACFLDMPPRPKSRAPKRQRGAPEGEIEQGVEMMDSPGPSGAGGSDSPPKKNFGKALNGAVEKIREGDEENSGLNKIGTDVAKLAQASSKQTTELGHMTQTLKTVEELLRGIKGLSVGDVKPGAGGLLRAAFRLVDDLSLPHLRRRGNDRRARP